ncbi:basic proline-rich protein-like [Chroicocephalus ridibundus]|uniref:basic proline-rich protein-like n=1 Tax=Chroicocephalus ridibundus TaxID=1192867 RepID=UPI002FDC8547
MPPGSLPPRSPRHPVPLAMPPCSLPSCSCAAHAPHHATTLPRPPLPVTPLPATPHPATHSLAGGGRAPLLLPGRIHPQPNRRVCRARFIPGEFPGRGMQRGAGRPLHRLRAEQPLAFPQLKSSSPSPEALRPPPDILGPGFGRNVTGAEPKPSAEVSRRRRACAGLGAPGAAAAMGWDWDGMGLGWDAAPSAWSSFSGGKGRGWSRRMPARLRSPSERINTTFRRSPPPLPRLPAPRRYGLRRRSPASMPGGGWASARGRGSLPLCVPGRDGPHHFCPRPLHRRRYFRHGGVSPASTCTDPPSSHPPSSIPTHQTLPAHVPTPPADPPSAFPPPRSPLPAPLSPVPTPPATLPVPWQLITPPSPAGCPRGGWGGDTGTHLALPQRESPPSARPCHGPAGTTAPCVLRQLQLPIFAVSPCA